MKIALYVSKMNEGGAERTMANIANYMAGRGHEVVMINAQSAPNDYPLDPSVRRLYSEPESSLLGSDRIRNFRLRFSTLKNIWVSEKPDVIFSYLGKTNIMTLLTTRKLHIPVGVGVVAEPRLEYEGLLMSMIAKRTFKWADGVVLQTRESASFFPKSVQAKSVILKNPMTPEFDIERYNGPRDKNIVSVGRVDENKNHELIINAFASLSKEFPEYTLTIYGDGELRNELIGKVESLGLSGRIFLPGRVNDIPEKIKRSTAFVLSSNSEGSPNALIEAMMLGLAVISTDCPCGGPAELIENQKNGILIPVNDKEALTKALRDIMSDPGMVERLGTNASNIRDIYSPKIVMKKWEEFFLQLKEHSR